MFKFRTNAETFMEFVTSDDVPSYYVAKSVGLGSWNTTINNWTYNAYINLQMTSNTHVVIREASWNNSNLKIGLICVYGIVRL